MNLKRTLAVVFCMILMVSCLLIPASAASASKANIVVVADKSEVKAGEIVTFSVVLKNADKTPEGIYSYDAKVAISGGLTLVEGSVKPVANEGFFAPTFNSKLRCMSTGYNAEGNGGKGYNKGDLTLGTFQCKVESEGTATVSAVVFTENGYSEELGMIVNVVTNGVGGSATVSIAHEHVYGEWITEIKPSCLEDGEDACYCACGDRKTRVNPAIGHNWGEWTVKTEPTCVSEGLKIRICSNCNGESKYIIPATGEHTYGDEWITDVEPNCCDEGHRYKVCSVCGGAKIEETLKPLGHLPGDPVKENYKAPTEAEDGGYDLVVYCLRCGEVLESHWVVLPATGRDPGPNTGDFTVALGMVLVVVMMIPCLLVSKFRAVK